MTRLPKPTRFPRRWVTHSASYHYIEGWGVERDAPKAVEYYARAALGGQKQALEDLAALDPRISRKLEMTLYDEHKQTNPKFYLFWGIPICLILGWISSWKIVQNNRVIHTLVTVPTGLLGFGAGICFLGYNILGQTDQRYVSPRYVGANLFMRKIVLITTFYFFVVWSFATTCLAIEPHTMQEIRSDVKNGDFEKAFKTVRSLAATGDPEAESTLGMFYGAGVGVKEDTNEALKWFHKAAQKNNVQARFMIGLMYHNGDGVPKNDKEAEKWWKLAADQGHGKAQELLAQLYYQGDGIQQDNQKALELLKKAAAKGLSGAQFNLGIKYSNGEGVTKDLKKAAELWTKAAKQGMPEAEYNLGLAYEHGEGVTSDDTKAGFLYQAAADRGLPAAQVKLAALYREGKIFEKDTKQTVKWLEKAALAGDADAQYILGKLYHTGDALPKDDKQAANWWQKAAEQGLQGAQNALGDLYADGQGVPKDKKMANMWWQKAAAQGGKEAKQNLTTSTGQSSVQFGNVISKLVTEDPWPFVGILACLLVYLWVFLLHRKLRAETAHRYPVGPWKVIALTLVPRMFSTALYVVFLYWSDQQTKVAPIAIIGGLGGMLVLLLTWIFGEMLWTYKLSKFVNERVTAGRVVPWLPGLILIISAAIGNFLSVLVGYAAAFATLLYLSRRLRTALKSTDVSHVHSEPHATTKALGAVLKFTGYRGMWAIALLSDAAEAFWVAQHDGWWEGLRALALLPYTVVMVPWRILFATGSTAALVASYGLFIVAAISYGIGITMTREADTIATESES